MPVTRRPDGSLEGVVWQHCLSNLCPSWVHCARAYKGTGIPPGGYGLGWPVLKHPTEPDHCEVYQPTTAAA